MKRLPIWAKPLFALVLLALTIPANAQVKPNRDSAEYYFHKGTGFMEDNRVPEPILRKRRLRAIANYTKAIAFDNNSWWSYRNRGYCYEAFGEYEQALADYNKAVSVARKNGDDDGLHVHLRCANMCVQLCKWSEAEAHYSALVFNEDKCPGEISEVYWDRANARVELKKYGEAKGDYTIVRNKLLQRIQQTQKSMDEVGVNEIDKSQLLDLRTRYREAEEKILEMEKLLK